MNIYTRDYSCDQEKRREWYIKDTGTNISSTIDKLVRLAAKWTDRFASDIVYDINFINKRFDEIQNNESDSESIYIVFRCNGVTSTNRTTDGVHFDFPDCVYDEAKDHEWVITIRWEMNEYGYKDLTTVLRRVKSIPEGSPFYKA